MRTHHTAREEVGVIILLGDFVLRGENSFVRGSNSGKKAEFLAKLDGLGAPPGAQFVKNTAGVGLHRVLAHKKLFGYLAVAQALGYQFEDLELAGRDGQFLSLLIVLDERPSDQDRNFLHDNSLLTAC